MTIKEYAFDVTLFAVIRVKATSEKAARAMIRDALNGSGANLGAWPDGAPIMAEVSADGICGPCEIDGEPAE
jgi:hypothetical protein